MSRRLMRVGALFAIVGVLVGCGASGDERAREDYGFKGSSNAGTPFDLTIKTGLMESAKEDRTLTGARGNKSMTLGDSDFVTSDQSRPKCANPANHDDVFELTFQAKVTNSAADNLELTLMLDVADSAGNLVTSESDNGVRIAWLTESLATCQTTSEDTFAKMSLSKGEKYQVKGLLVLPGGAENYDGYTLSVLTNAGKIHDPKGGVKSYKGDLGVTVDLIN